MCPQACEEWFVRLRPHQMRLAGEAGHHSAVVFHACQHLAHLQRLSAALLELPPKKAVAANFAPPTPAAVSAPRDVRTSSGRPDTAANLPEKDWPSLGAAAATGADINKTSKQPKNSSTMAAAAGEPIAEDASMHRKQEQQGKQKHARQRKKAIPVAEPVVVQRVRTRSSKQTAAVVADAATVQTPAQAKPQISAHQRKQRLQSIANEVAATLRHAGHALCAMSVPDTLVGLHAHAVHAFRQTFAAAGYVSFKYALLVCRFSKLFVADSLCSVHAVGR